MGKGFGFLCNNWNEIGPFDMNSFGDRLILQKKIFLIQEMGEDLGYVFGKYIYGPYCSQLAKDGYKAVIMEDENMGCSCNKTLFIDKLRKLEAGHKGDYSWFELLGTITYFKNKAHKSKEEVISLIIEEKPYLFNEDLFEEAYSRLINLEIITA